MSYNSRRIPRAEKGYQPTQEDVATAMEKFRENGGLIKRLPDEEVLPNLLVVPKRLKNASPYEVIRGMHVEQKEEIMGE